MIVIFAVAGIVSGFHVYTYGRWLKQQGNIPAAYFSFLLATATAVLPIYHYYTK
ncbi:MAG: hypothetical protein H6Q75_503 [Firmicutes bacterium]|nr:hypothetical protein [Bacillota bacterium]